MIFSRIFIGFWVIVSNTLRVRKKLILYIIINVDLVGFKYQINVSQNKYVDIFSRLGSWYFLMTWSVWKIWDLFWKSLINVRFWFLKQTPELVDTAPQKLESLLWVSILQLTLTYLWPKPIYISRLVKYFPLIIAPIKIYNCIYYLESFNCFQKTILP